MTCLTFSYKKHYIHVSNLNPKKEIIQAQILDNTEDTYGSCTIHQVKSVQAAKLLITKHVKIHK